MSDGTGLMIIPAHCPRFVAACAAVGVQLQAGTPGITNVYSIDRKYDPEEPGEIRYLLSNQGINPLAISKAWRDPELNLADQTQIVSRILKCKTLDEWESIAADLEILHVYCGIAHMKLFSQGKFAIDGPVVSDGEKQATQFLSDLPEAMRATPLKNKGQIAARVAEMWPLAMFAWVKAWVGHYIASRDHWKAARPAIKIDRGDDFPLIIPKGKDFEKLMKRWVK